MRTLLITLTTAWMLSLFASSGSQAIYKTSGHQTVLGGGNTTKLATKGFLIIDLSETNVHPTAIGAFTVNGQKIYTIVPLQNYRFTKVTGASGLTYDVLAKAESPGTQFAGTVLESVFFQGKESLITIDSTGPRSMPKVVTGAAQNIVHNDSNGVTAASTALSTGVIDTKGSLASNLAGETFDNAVNRLAATFEVAGYTRFTTPPTQ